MTTKTRAKLVRAVILLLLLLLLLMWCTKLYVTVRNGLTVPPSSLPQRHKTGGSGRLPAPDWNKHFSYKTDGSGFDFQ